MENKSVQCPICKEFTRTNKDNFIIFEELIKIQNKLSSILLLKNEVFICQNEECNEVTIDAYLYSATEFIGYGKKELIIQRLLFQKRVIPNSKGKNYPSFIPKAIINDYQEAYAIKDLSPKASASLCRRCLQGMIRDFWGINKSRLIDEILALENKVDSGTWKAIDAIRVIGNIGAHMEHDVNLIVDVEPDEAKSLIELIEYLIETWYIEKHNREEKLKKLAKIADDKKDKKKG
jgi:hypothetical protein